MKLTKLSASDLNPSESRKAEKTSEKASKRLDKMLDKGVTSNNYKVLLKVCEEIDSGYEIADDLLEDEISKIEDEAKKLETLIKERDALDEMNERGVAEEDDINRLHDINDEISGLAKSCNNFENSINSFVKKCIKEETSAKSSVNSAIDKANERIDGQHKIRSLDNAKKVLLSGTTALETIENFDTSVTDQANISNEVKTKASEASNAQDVVIKRKGDDE